MSADKARQEVRQEMYKSSNKSPCWKDKFRQRCLDRLKDSRGRYLSSRRSLDNFNDTDLSASELNVKGQSDCDENNSAQKSGQRSTEDRIQYLDVIMMEEFDRLKGEVSLKDSRSSIVEDNLREIDCFCNKKNFEGNDCRTSENNHSQEHRVFPTRSSNDCCNHSEIHEADHLNEDILASWYEEIYETLKAELKEAQEKEEQKSLQDACDEHLKYQEQELCSSIQALLTEEVICPICGKFNLREQKNEILCKCGLKIDVEQDCITLKYVKDSLKAGTDEHSQKCESKPIFSLNQKFGISNLLMSCQDCDFLFVIV